MIYDASTSTGCELIEISHTYLSLFDSNSYPPPEVHIDAKSLTKEHERQLFTVQDLVERLRRCLADVERRQVQTSDILVKLHTTLAPIKRLPPEILSNIFELCLDVGNSGVLFSTTPRSKDAPLLLGRVCRSWRAITHATPRLWRDVLVNVCDGQYSEKLRKDAFPVLQTWLARSGSLPLNLFVLCKTERVLPGLTDIFETIAAHAARWQTIQLRLQNSPSIYRLVCRIFVKCTSLSTLDVTDSGQCMSFLGSEQPDDAEDVHPVRFNLSLAPLHRLSLSLAGLAIRDVRAPWATLTRLSFMQDARSSTTSITDYVAVLKQCTSLKECSITIDGGIRGALLERLTLPRLECLELLVLREASRTTQTGDFLDVLDAPRLCALAIEDYCPRREAVLYHGQLKVFLQRHAQSLRRLKFSTSSKFFIAQDLVALIAETPLLTELEYHPDEASSPRALLEALMPWVQGDVVVCLLPYLERFFVYWDTTETVSKVGEMVEKRCALVERGIAQMKYVSCRPVRVSIMYDTPPHALVEDLAARLAPFCQCGLQVDWEVYRRDLEFVYC